MKLQVNGHHRWAGVLLHPTSLPGPEPSGDLGQGAHEFLDFLKDSGQSFWQMLPIHPMGAGDSPYSSTSAFAGDPLLIGPDAWGLVGRRSTSRRRKKVVPSVSRKAAGRTDFGASRVIRARRWRSAFAEADQRGELRGRDFRRFVDRSEDWLRDFSLFASMSEHFGSTHWHLWPDELRRRRAAALAKWESDKKDHIEFCCYLQFVWDSQWQRLKEAATERGVALMGDLPIFVDWGSADVWANQKQFLLSAKGNPRVVSGVPPDDFNPAGQVWGHALYRWDVMEEDGFRWWLARLRRLFDLFDWVRIDHFIGFHRCWHVPATSMDARKGRWHLTPGDALFARARKEIGELPLFAEDLGTLVPEVHQLRDRFGFPGMRVMQFGFGGSSKSDYHRPHSFPAHCIAYTGTHDNDTTRGWLDSIDPRRPRSKRPAGFGGDHVWRRVSEYVGAQGRSSRDITLAAVRALYASSARWVCTPMQDLLGLGSDCRMNSPGTLGSQNWTWRMSPLATTEALRDRLYQWTRLFNRTGATEP